MTCCDIRNKAIREIQENTYLALSNYSLEKFKKFYLNYIAPLFLLKENCCSQCQKFRSQFQKGEDLFDKNPEKVRIRIGKVNPRELFRKENYPKENVFYLGCETKNKAQDWIREKASLLGDDIIWIADKSLKELGVIRKERKEERLIDDSSLPDSFLLVFFSFTELKSGDVDFSRAYAMIVDEDHRGCLREEWNSLRKCIFCKKNEAEVVMAWGEEYESLANYARLNNSQGVCAGCFKSIKEEKAEGDKDSIEIAKVVTEKGGGEWTHEFHCDDCREVVKIIKEFKEASKEAFLTKNEDETDRLGRIAYDKIVAYKQEKSSLCENGEKYLLEMKRVLKGTRYKVE